MLRPDDKLHFFTSPYRRTRETTEGILESLTSSDPSPSPFPRHAIKVYEEPRLREQDFGNFQPCSAEMERMWQERADYGHFFYRIPNGESAADAYDRVSGFNESLWRLFSEDDFASVCVLVTHGLMTRVFLMKWYHFSVEYFEDLRNINHCEFVVMQKNTDNGKYMLHNQLRTWSELKRERELAAKAAAASLTPSAVSPISPIPVRRRWGGCPDGCNHSRSSHRKKKSQRQISTLGLDEENHENIDIDKQGQSSASQDQQQPNEKSDTSFIQDYTAIGPSKFADWQLSESAEPAITHPKPQSGNQTPVAMMSESDFTRGLSLLHLGGRDAGGSHSGGTSRVSLSPSENHGDEDNDTDENNNDTNNSTNTSLSQSTTTTPLTMASNPIIITTDNNNNNTGGYTQSPQPKAISIPGEEQKTPIAVADSLGDRDDGENDEGLFKDRRKDNSSSSSSNDDSDDELGREENAVEERARKYDQSIRGSVY